MQNVKKLSRTAAAFLLAALILICSTVLPNTGTTASAASAELTSIGLAEHALKAYRDGWQYSYGAYGNFNSNGVRASDCSGLIYSYFCWVDDNSNIQPNWNYPRTVTAQANDAVESGPIDTIPRTHGLIVTIANYDHVGVYVGNGMVVDNSTWGVNMRYESIPGHGWLQWHKLGSITYPTTGWYKFDGDYFYYENGEYVINTTRTINGVTYTFGSDGVSDKTPSSANGSFSEANSAFNAKTTAGVRLRKGPGLSYDTITVLAEGTKVNVTSTKNSEWYAVTTASGQKGYVFSEYLNVTGTVNEDDSSDSGSSDNSNTGTNGEAAKTTTGVHLRSGKGTNYSSLGVIPGGTAITVTDKSDVWYAVTVNGKSGYMYSEYIKLTDTGSSDNNTSSGSTDGSASAQTNEDVHLREGRGTNYRSLGVIANGTAITVTDTSVSDWYGVTVNGKSGYMFSEYITMNGSNSGSTDSSASSDTMRTTAYLNLRSGTGTDTNVLTVIPEGASVTVLEKTTSEWYKVSYGSRTGYVFTEYLK